MGRVHTLNDGRQRVRNRIIYDLFPSIRVENEEREREMWKKKKKQGKHPILLLLFLILFLLLLVCHVMEHFGNSRCQIAFTRVCARPTSKREEETFPKDGKAKGGFDRAYVEQARRTARKRASGRNCLRQFLFSASAENCFPVVVLINKEFKEPLCEALEGRKRVGPSRKKIENSTRGEKTSGEGRRGSSTEDRAGRKRQNLRLSDCGEEEKLGFEPWKNFS
ncbi:hypothetical protein RUM43_011329 [Polyplax serrata]|uniref:Transmembrane protein n=1 Tax=Polyplax serrata TaxID=468196 RepID=A0AAN8NTK2_POLSC